jgi:hypothetical protein
MRRCSHVVIMLLMGFVLKCAAQLPGYNSHPEFDPTIQGVSLIQLIANPQAFDGKKVQFIGFLNLEFEGDAVYLHTEDFQNGISRNAIWIDVPREMTKEQQQAVNRHYVICAGIFHADRHGHLGMFGGDVGEVTRIQGWR